MPKVACGQTISSGQTKRNACLSSPRLTALPNKKNRVFYCVIAKLLVPLPRCEDLLLGDFHFFMADNRFVYCRWVVGGGGMK